MDKKGLVDAVAEAIGSKKKREIAQIIDTAFGVIVETVAIGEDVQLVRFGRFHRMWRAKRRAFSAKTGGVKDVPAHWRMNFRPSPSVREIIKYGDDYNYESR